MEARRRSRPWVGLVALFACGTAPAAAADDAPLAWSFPAGTTWKYEFHQKNTIKTKSAGQDSTTVSELTIEFAWSVGKVDAEGVAEVKMDVRRARVTLKPGSQTFHFDSSADAAKDEPAVEPLRTVYAPAVDPGSHYLLKIDPTGTVRGVQIPAKVADALQGSPFLAMADGGSVFSEEGVKNLFAQVVPQFPTEAAKTGLAWTTSVDVPAPGLTLVLKFENAVGALDAGSARIDAKVNADLKADEGSGLQAKVKAHSGTREAAFDRKAGRLDRSKVRHSLSFTLESPNGPVEQETTIEEDLKAVP